ncbi:PREDICTED: uncharacterized protein LOC109582106 [Amphimedon queenslandica]|uniref:IgGFc-binding protein N-terminal domain-containing protein n=1 Tax=Amphimedon queenslandica TaxID=400682 RepID=A0A1X7UUK2_AMPQE|nr:PREDICTED: uncharacterized protein LOC109582106 [Amphimedon queenslandica]|eukprot:XP_019852265.1 PREDICTED: uncharacterized protein LOC109582106 [Amphimedon queenslandica]
MEMFWSALCFLAFVKSDSASLVNLQSNNGREFYFGFMLPVSSFINPVVLVDTLNTSTRFSIDYPKSRNISNVASNRTHAYLFVMEASSFFPQQINEYYTMNSKERNKSFRLTVNDSSSKSVSIKCFLRVGNAQPTSSYLALPYMALLVDEYEYYAISIGSDSGSDEWSALLIVGNRNDTELYITPTVNVSLPRDLQDPDSEEILIQAGETFGATLHSMQTLLIRNRTNITGTRVVSNRPISFISGHSAGTLVANNREPVSQQLLPTTLWGNSFLLVPFVPQNIAQYFRVLASINETGFTYYCSNKQGSNVSNISSGEAYMFYVPPQIQCYLEAENPVFITQYPDISNTDEGDVTMITVASMNQYSNELIISPLRANGGSPLSHYVSISVPIEHFNEEQILYNDKPLDTEKWIPINDSTEMIVGYSYGFKFLSDDSLETHYILRHSDPKGRLFAMVYGFAAGRAYGYPAGLAFQPENILGIKFSEDMYNVIEGDFILWLPVIRLRPYSQNISLAYFIEKFTENGWAVLERGLLTLLPSDDRVNVSVPITEDKVVELTDMLRVRLYSMQEELKDTYISAFVNIVDDDTYTIGILELSYNQEMKLFMITVGATDGELMYGDSVVLYLNATITYPNGSQLLLPLDYNQMTFGTYSSRFSLEFKISHWLPENETISNHSITCELFKSDNKPEIILDPSRSRLLLTSAMHSTTTSQPATTSSTTSSSTTSSSTISSSNGQHYTALPNITSISVVHVNITMISTVIIYATKIVTVAPNTTSRTTLPTSTTDTSPFSSSINTSDILLPSMESVPLQSSVSHSPHHSPLFSDLSSKATSTRQSVILTASRTISKTPITGGSIGNDSSSMMNLYLSIGIIAPCALILVILSGVICYFSGKRRQKGYTIRDRANTETQLELLERSRVVLTGASGSSTLESAATLPAAPEPNDTPTKQEAQDSPAVPAPSPVYDIALRESTISTFKPETEATQASPPAQDIELQAIQNDYEPIA